MISISLLFAAGLLAQAAPQTNSLADLDLAGMKQGWGTPRAGVAVDGPPLRVAGQNFESGIGTHAPAVWPLPLAGKATEFRAKVGVQEYANNPGLGSVEFIVRGDDRILWRSGVLRGKDAAKEARVSLVYEFWSHQFLGSFRGQVELPALKAMGLASFALREQLARPQLVSTSRHLSQGGVDLVSLEWKDNSLAGRSRVIAGDRYEIAIRLPAGFKLKSAEVAGQPAQALTEGELVRLAWTPAATAEIEWKLVTSSDSL